MVKQSYPLGRINVMGEAKFSPKEGGKNLNYTIKHHWPKDVAEIDILITPGAFIYNEIDGEAIDKNNKYDATSNDIKEFVKQAQKNVQTMLDSSNLLKSAQGKVKYFSIGSDVWIGDYKAELVFLVCVKSEKIINWTGKSYPTESEVGDVVQVRDLKTHFKRVLNHRVMILGCHDLHMLGHRGKKSKGKKTNKEIRKEEMAESAKKFKPTMVIQHPHTTDSPHIWGSAWGSLRKDYPTVKYWASGISFYRGKKKLRAPYDLVIKATKSGDNTVKEITLKEK